MGGLSLSTLHIYKRVKKKPLYVLHLPCHLCFVLVHKLIMKNEVTAVCRKGVSGQGK